MSYYTVSTNGHGLVVREVLDNDTTVYADTQVAAFDTWEEAEAFAEAHDSEYYDD
jgi:hypothetical protein